MAFSITFITLIFYRISRTFSKTNRTDSSLHFNFLAIQKCYRMPIVAVILRPVYFYFRIVLTSGNVICLYFSIKRSQISPICCHLCFMQLRSEYWNRNCYQYTIMATTIKSSANVKPLFFLIKNFTFFFFISCHYYI